MFLMAIIDFVILRTFKVFSKSFSVSGVPNGFITKSILSGTVSSPSPLGINKPTRDISPQHEEAYDRWNYSPSEMVFCRTSKVLLLGYQHRKAIREYQCPTQRINCSRGRRGTRAHRPPVTKLCGLRSPRR